MSITTASSDDLRRIIADIERTTYYDKMSVPEAAAFIRALADNLQAKLGALVSYQELAAIIQGWRKTKDYLELSEEPGAIEYLKIETGETFTHTGVTAYWDYNTQSLNAEWLMNAGITHWRVKEMKYEYHNPR